MHTRFARIALLVALVALIQPPPSASSHVSLGDAGVWTTVARMPTARSYLAAATGRDGRIYAMGGMGATGRPVGTVQAYNPSTNSWTTVAPMPTPRYGLAAAVGQDGRIYAVGGLGLPGPLNTVEAYNPSTNAWTTVAPMHVARFALAAAVGSDGRIYAIGGFRPGAGGARVPLNSVEAYNPSANTWTTVAPMPTARGNLAAATGTDGRIYAIGGSGAARRVEAYSLTAHTWTSAAFLNSDHDQLAVATGADGRIYAIGGFGSVHLNTVEAYSPSTDTWTTVAPLPTGRYGLAAAAGPDGRIYAIGGKIGTTTTATVEAFTPRHKQPAPAPTARPRPAHQAPTARPRRPRRAPAARPSLTLNPVQAFNAQGTPQTSFHPGEQGYITVTWTIHNLKQKTTTLIIERRYFIPSGSGWAPLRNGLLITRLPERNGPGSFDFIFYAPSSYPAYRVGVRVSFLGHWSAPRYVTIQVRRRFRANKRARDAVLEGQGQ